MEVYSLVSSAKRHLPDFTQLPPGHRICSFIHKPSQLLGEHTARLPFPAHRTIQTHKPSLSYQVPTLTYSWVERVHVWAKCLAYRSTTSQHDSAHAVGDRLTYPAFHRLTAAYYTAHAVVLTKILSQFHHGIRSVAAYLQELVVPYRPSRTLPKATRGGSRDFGCGGLILRTVKV